jgi:hypothetical protein
MLSTNKKVWTLGTAILIAAGLAYVHAADVANDDAASGDAAMVAAAQKTYDKLIAMLATREFGNSDEIYLWSRRLLDAESRANRGNRRALLDAAEAHEKRIVQLADIRGRLAEAGQTYKTAASEFYLLEAKALVEDAGRGQ